MARKFQKGQVEEIIYVRLEPGEDVLEAIWEICEEHEIATGQILGGSGALDKFRFQHYPSNPKMVREGWEDVTEVIELDGPLETNIVGTIGTTIVDDDAPEFFLSPTPEMPTLRDVETMTGSPTVAAGTTSPYVHAHVTATNPHVTMIGHLMPGTLVRKAPIGAEDPPSHFTLVIAKVSGVRFLNRFGSGGLFHDFG